MMARPAYHCENTRGGPYNVPTKQKATVASSPTRVRTKRKRAAIKAVATRCRTSSSGLKSVNRAPAASIPIHRRRNRPVRAESIARKRRARKHEANTLKGTKLDDATAPDPNSAITGYEFAEFASAATDPARVP